MKFGMLKSKIEKKLLESYNTDAFKSEMTNFKKLVLSNKEASKMFNYYNELSSNKGLNESDSKEFIDEILNMIKSVNVNESSIKEIKKWVLSVKSKNEYKNIDDLISESSDISKRLNLKKSISESLCKKNSELSPIANIPLKSMVSIANKTLSNFLQTLNESEQKELSEIIKMKDDEIKNNFNLVKEEVITKLKSHLNSCVGEEKEKISETISVIENKEVNKIEFYKLTNLNKLL